MAFTASENTPRGANRLLIPTWGGSRNGGTSFDYTIYYEVVPKDALEKLMWIDSDRLGFMINTVDAETLEGEIQVVKNEKRQRVDNQPYGHSSDIIQKALYPESHPYSWSVIGELEDLQAATIDDVKEFYNEFYGPSNATVVIAGDIEFDETKKLVERWFGEIKPNANIQNGLRNLIIKRSPKHLSGKAFNSPKKTPLFVINSKLSAQKWGIITFLYCCSLLTQK